MKTIRIAIVLLTVGLVCSLRAQDAEIHPNIEAEVPLAKAVKDFNQKYPDNNPLTEEEVIAAIRQIKCDHPDIPDPMYKLYLQVVEKRILPKGMYFSRIECLISGSYRFEVDWKDLTLDTNSGGLTPKIGLGDSPEPIRC